MNAVKELILGKLEHLEALSEPVLQEVLDFVSYLEWRLDPNHRPVLGSKLVEENLARESEEDTSSFLLGIATSFATGLSDKDLECLPTDGAEHHDRYLYNSQL
ncbi:hypothetical protein TUMEXPCC7403_03490 [Tumidithrix helvetica PCC 7403]|uniref:hypothetical protein n=1 Tax=Tumidithrix helvetica TaxID=3457545 RepID=UPI003CACF0A9